jgi:hypothetical protein
MPDAACVASAKTTSKPRPRPRPRPRSVHSTARRLFPTPAAPAQHRAPHSPIRHERVERL